MNHTDNTGLLGRVRELCSLGKVREAEHILLPFLVETLKIDCRDVAIKSDSYSLNSVNGIINLNLSYLGESQLFFKYHQEDNEQNGVSEYYNSKLLEDAGLPVDVPLGARNLPGEQILLYRVRTDKRLADVCREIEQENASIFSFEEIVSLQEKLDVEVGDKYLKTLRLESNIVASQSALHQLFYHRLADAGSETQQTPGGRLASFYLSSSLQLSGLSEPLSWSNFSRLRWRINGRNYKRSIGELFAEATKILDPKALPNPCATVLGHGDAHNANVWVESRSENKRLVMFDPAFAGAHLPALLAEIKPTFHNIFAHRDWLYHPENVPNIYNANATISDDLLIVEHDWELPSLRSDFLKSKKKHIWIPLLAAVSDFTNSNNNQDWQRYIRLALFCCPTLVMNLVAGVGRHNPTSSLLAFSIAMMCGSECDSEDDVISEFMYRIAPSH